MAEKQFSINRYKSLPNLRISKTKYLVTENEQLFFVKLKSDYSLFTPLFHTNEIQKIYVQMQEVNNRKSLHFFILPKMGKKKHYLIRPKNLIRYTAEDWQQIPKFLRFIDFKPDPNPNIKRKLEVMQSRWKFYGVFNFFNSKDRIFQLFQKEEFVKELNLLKISSLLIIALAIGGCGLLIAPIFAVIDYSGSKLIVWISTAIAIIFLGYSIPLFLNFFKKRKKFSEKYDIAYYFKK